MRSNDASDATVNILHQQLTYDLGAIEWTRIDASISFEGTLRRARDLL